MVALSNGVSCNSFGMKGEVYFLTNLKSDEIADSDKITDKSGCQLWYTRRSISRILAVQATYAMMFYNKYNVDELISYLYEVKDILDLGNFDRKLLMKILNSITDNFTKVDSIIEKHLNEKWSINRLNLISLSIIKTALCEFLCCNIDIGILVNEYANIASQSVEHSEVNFINGILNRMHYIRENK